MVPRSSYSTFGWSNFMLENFYLEQRASRNVSETVSRYKLLQYLKVPYISVPAPRSVVVVFQGSKLFNSIPRYLAGLAAYRRRTKERSSHLPGLWKRRSHVLKGCSGMPSCCVAAKRMGCIAASQPYSLCAANHMRLATTTNALYV
jgi:hypothetical protein